MDRKSASDSKAHNVPVVSASKFCKDDLSLIFSNLCITTRDLLNFRLVNKSWRDAASTILLRRDACYVALEMKMLQQPKKNRDDNRFKAFNFIVCRYGDKKANLNELSKLTELMSSSTNFPTSNFHVHSSCYSVTNYSDFSDLMLLFKLHGEKVKTFRPHGCVSQEMLLDICFNFTPKLERLDLSEAFFTTISNTNRKRSDQDTGPKRTLKLLPFKCLVFPSNFDEKSKTHRQIMHLLLSSPSKLDCIQNVKLSTLPFVFEEEKGHFIRSFIYITDAIDMTVEAFESVMKQFCELNPKLSSLTLEVENFELFLSALRWINPILESSKGSMQTLKIGMKQYFRRYSYPTKLKIPSMKSLQCLTLNGRFWPYISRRSGIKDEDASLFSLDDNVSPAKYFPSLIQVSLNHQDLSTEKNFLRFFTMSSSSDATVCNPCLATVEVLEIQNSTLSESWIWDPSPNLITKTFPNIRVLQIKVKNLRNLNDSLWTMCPLVEFIEIKGTTSDGFHLTEDTSPFFDNLFTGFSQELCSELLTRDLPQQHMGTAESLSRLRTKPSVCDLKHLKEFKMRYSGRLELVSRVSETYAFSRMPNTKFDILYNSKEEYPECSDLHESSSEGDSYIDYIFDLTSDSDSEFDGDNEDGN